MRKNSRFLALISEYDVSSPRGGSISLKTRLITGVFIFPSWMFVTGDDVDANGEYTSYLNTLVYDIILDEVLRISISMMTPGIRTMIRSLESDPPPWMNGTRRTGTSLLKYSSGPESLQATGVNQSGQGYESGLFSRELFIGGGLVKYVLTAIDTPDSTREIFTDLYRFLEDPLVAEPESQFRNDIGEMSEGQLELIQRGMDLDPVLYFENFGYQYNGPIIYSGEIDYYGDLGRVFAR